MTTYAPRPTIAAGRIAPAPTSKGRLVVKWLTSTDHKTIGYLYLMTSAIEPPRANPVRSC